MCATRRRGASPPPGSRGWGRSSAGGACSRICAAATRRRGGATSARCVARRTRRHQGGGGGAKIPRSCLLSGDRGIGGRRRCQGAHALESAHRGGGGGAKARMLSSRLIGGAAAAPSRACSRVGSSGGRQSDRRGGVPGMSMGARDTYPTVGGGRPVWAPWGQNPMGTSRVDAYRVLRAEPTQQATSRGAILPVPHPGGGG